MISTHYALDVPRGCRIVNPVEHNNQTLSGLVIERVLNIQSDDGVEVTFTDGSKAILPRWLRITVDQGSPERQARLAWAETILGMR